MTNIYNLVQERARRSPDQTAIIDCRKNATRSCSFAELDQASAKIAALLWQQGLRPGDSVLIFQPMSIELYQLIAAIFRSGMVALFIEPTLDKQTIKRFCEQQTPKAIVFSPPAQLLRLLIPSLRHIPVKITIGTSLPGDIKWNDYRHRPPRTETIDLPPETAALISLTSGSTGLPKGIARSHGFLLTQHRVLEQTLNHRPNELSLVTLPLFVLSNLASGVTSILPCKLGRNSGPAGMERLVTLVNRYQPASAIGGPALFQGMAGYCKTKGMALPSLKRIFVGGAPVMPTLFDDLKAMSPETETTVVYGATEAEPITTLTYTNSIRRDFDKTRRGKGLLVGKPVDGIEVKVLPDQWGKQLDSLSREAFDKQPLPPNRIGEIVVSGTHVLDGYLEDNLNQLTKIDAEQTIWHRTGDAGYFDVTGRLWLVGRCAARIASGEESLYPLMIESAACCRPGVHQAALTKHQGRLLLLLEADPHGTIDIDNITTELPWAGIDELRVVKRIPVDRRHHSKIDIVALNALVKRIAIRDALFLGTVRRTNISS